MVEKRYATLGRVKDFVDANCDGAAVTRVFWGPDFEVHVEVTEEGHMMVATKIAHVNEASEVMWEQPGMKLIGFPTTAKATEQLVAFKRK